MKVFNRQKLGATPLKPCCPGCTPALRAMPIAAGAIEDLSMATMVALFDAATEDCGLADRDLSQRSFLLSGERVSKRREVSWTVDAENVGQLQRRSLHRAGFGSTGCGSRSRGLTVERTARLETCRYLAVVFRLRCPMRIWMRRKSVDSSSRWVAKQCRKVWGDTGLARCAASLACLQMRQTVTWVIGRSGLSPGKSQVTGRQ